jgi:hypothetical protein
MMPFNHIRHVIFQSNRREKIAEEMKAELMTI